MQDTGILVFKNKLKKELRRGIVLDIDETLSWTIGHWVEQMQQLFGNPEGLSVQEMVDKYRYTEHVPYWQTEEAIAWMVAAIHSNETQEKMPLIENATHFVQKIQLIVPIVGYVTVRPTAVISGTQNWLKKHNFPTADIIAKPDSVKRIDGNRWKASVIEALYPEVIGIVDDNPLLVDSLSKEYQGTVYLYNYMSSIRDDISVYPCKTWSDIHAKIKLLHNKKTDSEPIR